MNADTFSKWQLAAYQARREKRRRDEVAKRKRDAETSHEAWLRIERELQLERDQDKGKKFRLTREDVYEQHPPNLGK